MANKKSLQKSGPKPEKMNREARRRRTANIVFLIICGLMILSLIITAVAKF